MKNIHMEHLKAMDSNHINNEKATTQWSKVNSIKKNNNDTNRF